MSEQHTSGDTTQSHNGDDANRVDADIFAGGADPYAGAETELVNTQVEQFIAMSHLVPSVEWIIQNIVSKGKGYRQQLARFTGVARSAAIKTNMRDGKELVSVQLKGEFEAELFETGEVIVAGEAYLPKNWAGQVMEALESQLADDPECKPAAKMILTLGVQATGKGVPYRWTVSTHIRRPMSSDMAELKQLTAVVDRNSKRQLTLDVHADTSGTAD